MLNNEVAFLEHTEGNADASIISENIEEEFESFKYQIIETIEILENL
jgi:hypothetical protein